MPGKCSVKTAPPSGALVTAALPPCCSVTWRTMARPEPAALPAPGVAPAEEAVEHVGQVLGLDPGAVVTNLDAVGLDLELDGAAGRGVARRVVEQVVDRPRRAAPGPRRRAWGRAWPRSGCSGALRRARASDSAATPSRRTSSVSGPGWSPRASSIRSPTSALSSSLCSTTSASSRRRSSGSSSPPSSRTSMLVRRLVTGVRSSCEASATSWRWARTDSSSCRARALQAVEHGVEAGGELADLVVGVDAEASGEIVGLADVLGGRWRPRPAAPARGGRRTGRGPRRARCRRASTSSRTSRRSERIVSTPFSGRASWTARSRYVLPVESGHRHVAGRSSRAGALLPTCASVIGTPRRWPRRPARAWADRGGRGRPASAP